jgi:TonB-dependent Receptor Plug Domain
LAGVEVLIEGLAAHTLTGPDGRFLLPSAPPGRHVVLFRAVGFRFVREIVSVTTGDTAWVSPTLVRSALPLEPIVVTGTPLRPRGLGMEGFEERRKLGFGFFIDSAYLRRNEHRNLSDVLRAANGIIIVPADVHRHWAGSGRRFTRNGLPCAMQVFVDGVALNRAIAPEAGGVGNPVYLEDLAQIHDIEAIEVYRGAAEVPVEYGGAGAGCGGILIWLRRP